MISLRDELKLREQTGNSVRIGLLGTGQMGTDVVAEVKMMQGIDVVIAVDINLDRARDSFKIAEVGGEVV